MRISGITIKHVLLFSLALLLIYLPLFNTVFAQENNVNTLSIPSSITSTANIATSIFQLIYNDIVSPNSCNSSYNSMLTFAPTFLLLFFVILGVILTYYVGTVLQFPQLLNFVKAELNEIILSVLLVVFLASVSGITNQVFINTWGSDIGVRSVNFSLSMLYKIASDIGALTLFNVLLYSISSTSVIIPSTGFFRFSTSINVGPILKPLITIMGTINQFLVLALSEWVVHVVVLCFIQRWLLSLFLPLGVMMRIIPQTRGGGNALIAIAFSFFFFYPLMFTIDYEIFNMHYDPQQRCTQITDIPQKQQCLENSGRSSIPVIINDFKSQLGSTTIFMIAVALLMGSIFVPFLLSTIYSMIFYMVSDAIYVVLVFSIVLPILNIFLTLTFAREISKFLGTDINLAAFVRLL